MNYDESLSLSSAIGKLISGCEIISYGDDDIAKIRERYSKDDFEEMSALGIYDGDIDTFTVINKFCEKYIINEIADGDYLRKLYNRARRLSSRDFLSDPYLSEIKIPEVKIGDIVLTNQYYERGELFQYLMPSLSEETVVPYLGFFSKRVPFPALYHGNTPWVSVCPSEVNSMLPDTRFAHGRVLVLGLGLGYYPYIISGMEIVESITVAEIDPKIKDIFEKYILPQFPKKDKIKVVLADAVEYVRGVNDGEYDFVYADIWEGVEDGARHYLNLEKEEKRLKNTEFRYWIKDQIADYINRK